MMKCKADLKRGAWKVPPKKREKIQKYSEEFQVESKINFRIESFKKENSRIKMNLIQMREWRNHQSYYKSRGQNFKKFQFSNQIKRKIIIIIIQNRMREREREGEREKQTRKEEIEVMLKQLKGHHNHHKHHRHHRHLKIRDKNRTILYTTGCVFLLAFFFCFKFLFAFCCESGVNLFRLKCFIFSWIFAAVVVVVFDHHLTTKSVMNHSKKIRR